MPEVKLAEIIGIETPKKFILNGFWFGPKKAKRAFIFVHGLGSVGFAHHDFLLPLTDRNTGVMFFNNRGYGVLSGVIQKTRGKKGYKKHLLGMALEKFTDAADDIEGAVRFAEKKGATEIYLVGHSTGCQKITYYLSKKRDRRHVKGAVLMAPISDYAGIKVAVKPGVLRKALSAAEALVKRKKGSWLLPENLWNPPISAQRFVSLYKGAGPEELFPYWTKRNPAALRHVRKPLLVLLAAADQYADRAPEELENWFVKHLKDGDAIAIIRKADHGFHGKENAVAGEIGRWAKSL